MLAEDKALREGIGQQHAVGPDDEYVDERIAAGDAEQVFSLDGCLEVCLDRGLPLHGLSPT